jgi:Fe-S oxidoreductase
MALAQANVNEFNRLGVKKIITSCPECYYALKVDYPRMLGKTFAEVVYWTEAVVPLLDSGELRLGRLEEKVTYHDPCTLGRGLRIFESPRRILSAVKGLELVEMQPNRETALCCGASSWVHCGAANRQIQDERLTQAEATGAEVMVTSCPKCLIHLKCAQQSRNGKKPKIDIQDLARLAARSLDQEAD